LSLVVGLLSVTVGISIGIVVGATAGFIGGRFDSIVMRIMDVVLAFPAFLLAVGLVTIMGQGLLQIMIAVGITQVPTFARLLRGSVLAHREADYAVAATAIGTAPLAVLVVHILPNAIGPVIVQGALSIGAAIIEVAGLSFVGLGPGDPSLPEWGRMLAESANRLQTSSHLALFPGLAIVILVLGINLIGDGLREALDPKLVR
jgi:peptide/nickel transport system permease protein